MKPNPTKWGGRARKRVLVTGGAGFIGAHLCARLLEAEISVPDEEAKGHIRSLRSLID